MIYTTTAAGTNPKFNIFSDHFIAGSTTFTPAANTTARIYAKLPKNAYIPNYSYYAWVDDFILVAGAGPKVVDSADGNNNGILNITMPESSLTVPEKNTVVTTLQASGGSGPLTYSIIGGTDANYPTSTTNGIYQTVFWLDENTGVLKFADPPDFEKPVDRAKANIYSILVQVRDANGLVNKATINIKVTDVPNAKEPPVITSYDGRSFRQADEIRIFSPENRLDVTNVTATSHAGNLNYSLSGADASLFTIDGTGKLYFLAPPDFETPKDADKDNEYIVNITASDDSKLSDKQTLKVVVTNLKFTSQLTLKAGNIELSDNNSINNIYTVSHSSGKYIITDTNSNPDAGIEVIGVVGATTDPVNNKRLYIADSAFAGGQVSLNINAGAGDDTVYIDTQSGESPIPAKGLTIDLGVGKDNLFLVNTATTNTWTIDGPQSGNVSIGP